MIYTEKGPAGTARTLDIALTKAMELNLPIMAASTTGSTGVLLAEMAMERGFDNDIIVVGHAFGAKTPGVQDMLSENRDILLRHKARVVIASHVLSGVERTFSTQFGGVYPVEIIAHTLRMFSCGVKVAVEIGAMALDAQQLHYQQSVIAVGGTHRGADTAVRIIPNHARTIFDTKIQEILCMPS